MDFELFDEQKNQRIRVNKTLNEWERILQKHCKAQK